MGTARHASLYNSDSFQQLERYTFSPPLYINELVTSHQDKVHAQSLGSFRMARFWLFNLLLSRCPCSQSIGIHD